MVNMSLRFLSKPSEEQLTNIFKVRAPPQYGTFVCEDGPVVFCAMAPFAPPFSTLSLSLLALTEVGHGLGRAGAAVHWQ